MQVSTERYSLYLGDCLEVMKTFPDNSYDSIITDPPYMLNFMGKAFDTSKDNIAARVELWQECLRVAKPGAHLLAFGGDRTHHRLMVAIEDAGWEIRTCIYWLFGSGMPKALNISKAIDAHLGGEREVIGLSTYADKGRTKAPGWGMGDSENDVITAPATDAAKEFSGWFSGLKPAAEIIIVAMKPLGKGLGFAANALAHGVAGLWVDGCRIESEPELAKNWQRNQSQAAKEGRNSMNGGLDTIDLRGYTPTGRWPANLILDQSAADLLDEMSGESKSTSGGNRGNSQIWGSAHGDMPRNGHDDSGGSSRYFTVLPDSEPRFCYTAKASSAERNEGLDGLPLKRSGVGDDRTSGDFNQRFGNTDAPRMAQNPHPTVKPLSLMRWLVRLTKTPTGGVVLDPFAGSGSTGVACLLEGRKAVLIEREAEYHSICHHRLEHWQEEADTAPRKLRGGANDLADMPLFAEIQGD